MSVTAATADRSLALDALRGLAILLMVFSGRIPYGVLPDWMYHAQIPPPAHVFNGALPGITWVDLVFPFFLFAMGAAIPLALSRRLAEDAGFSGRFRVAGDILKRGALLAFFAIYVMHLRPDLMAAKPGAREWALALTGFLLLFPMLMALPATWSAQRRMAVRALGWLGAVLVLAVFTAKDGSGFSLRRSDIIILVLANVAVSGGFIWWLTRDRLDWRLGVLAFLLALRLTQGMPGWGQWLWNLSPVPWLGTVAFQQYLFIIIPGTIAGDLLLRASRAAESSAGATSGPTDAQHAALRALAGWLVLTLLVVLIGLKGRWVVPTTLFALCSAGVGWLLLQRAALAQPALLRGLLGWSLVWLLLGLAFEPFEGGIRKDRATLSYYFVTSGLAGFVLIAFSVWLKSGLRRGAGLLVATGQNPLLAYAGIHGLLTPVLGLTGLGDALQRLLAGPWLGVLRAALLTIALGAVTQWCTRRRWLLRA